VINKLLFVYPISKYIFKFISNFNFERFVFFQLFNVGQAFRQNRYPINFDTNGNMSMSYVKSCSIHYSFNRAINIDASNYITIENNVIYNVMYDFVEYNKMNNSCYILIGVMVLFLNMVLKLEMRFVVI
jgi:hypothetical protein